MLVVLGNLYCIVQSLYYMIHYSITLNSTAGRHNEGKTIQLCSGYNLLCKETIKGSNYAVTCHGHISPYTYPCGENLTSKISANKSSVFCTKLKLELKLNCRHIYSLLPE